MNKEMTPWFPPHVKPARIGVYETDADIKGGPCYQHWNGLRWGWCSPWSDYTVDSPSGCQDPNWRGFANKP